MLAGGRSSRFGRDKLAEPYRGVPLLQRAISRVSEVTQEIVVVVAPGAPDPEMPAGVSATIARDAEEGQGPLVGLTAGLAIVRTHLAVVVGGDMPDLQTDVLDLMMRTAERSGANAVVLEDADRFRPLPCVLSTGPGRDAVRRLVARGDRRLRVFLSELRPTAIPQGSWLELDPDGRTLLDVDEPEDLQR